jgi:amidophosphoribosyltransferase
MIHPATIKIVSNSCMRERTQPAQGESEFLQEKCGIVALFNPSSDVKTQLQRALKAGGGVQNRGQQGLGIGMNTPHGIVSEVRDGLIKDVATSEFKEIFTSEPSMDWMILHTRYGTNGGYGTENLQPCKANSPDGTEWAVIHNGEFVATQELRNHLQGEYAADVSDTYLFTQLLSQTNGADLDERVVNALSSIKGAYSMAIGVENRLYLARDVLGIKPFVLGELPEGWIAASETFALDKIGVPTKREILRGEISRIDQSGLRILKEGLLGPGQFCGFEPTYFSRPESMNPHFEQENDSLHPERWHSNAMFRRRLGLQLAKERDLSNLDFITGAPDSGVPFAAALSEGSKIPYIPSIFRDHFDDNGELRAFQADYDLERITEIVLGKLSFARDMFAGKKVGIGDDSIVRSKVSKAVTSVLYTLGATEVHWYLSFPPIRHTCHLGVSMRTYEELIAAQYDTEEEIAHEVGATSINYISPRGFARAKFVTEIQDSANDNEIFLRNHLCGGCITGEHPITKEGKMHPLAEATIFSKV